LKLALYAFYSGYHPAGPGEFASLYGEVVEAARSQDWDRLTHGTLRVEFQGEVRTARFRATNAQFTGLDRANPEFAIGYEPEIANLVDALLPDQGIFLDVGANWGYMSIYAASRPGFKGTIHAFEPIAETFADLDGLIRDLKLTEMVRCHQFALSDSEGQAAMDIPDNLSGLARISASGGASVALRRLDDLDLGPVDVIKLDVEGHEAKVVRGARRTLSEHKPFVFFEDGFDHGANRPVEDDLVSDALAELGYGIYFALFQSTEGMWTALPTTRDSQPLGVVPIDYHAARSKLPGHANFLACHSDRVGDLQARLAGHYAVA
jgi:FkbM family methyltransferase